MLHAAFVMLLEGLRFRRSPCVSSGQVEIDAAIDVERRPHEGSL